MHTLLIPETELYDEQKGEFITIKKTHINLEHSLYSIRKWESKWKKPYLSKDPKTVEETIDYVRCMIIGNVDNNILNCINNAMLKELDAYIHDGMTATTFKKLEEKRNTSIITCEVIYYWMISLQIPLECEKWHFNQLMTLIEVCNRMNSPQKKMNKNELAKRNRALNAQRRAKTGSKG